MLRCTPFLLFDGNCAEAMTFYHKCLGGELSLTKLGDTPMKDMLPKEKWNRLINAHIKSGNLEISATDWMASPDFDPKQGNTYAIFVIGNTLDELKGVFDKLKEWNEIIRDFRICTICLLAYMDNFMINMEFSGFSWRKTRLSQ